MIQKMKLLINVEISTFIRKMKKSHFLSSLIMYIVSLCSAGFFMNSSITTQDYFSFSFALCIIRLSSNNSALEIGG